MRIAVLVFIATIFFSLLAWPLVNNQVPFQSDLGRYHLPIRDFYQRCLQIGDNPDWCPNLFCGFDLHGEGQVGFDHPWHRLLYSTMPLTIAFNIEVFANYPFLFLGMFMFLRRHELSFEASLAGALAATFSGFTLAHYAHTNAIAIIAHIPWLLWAADIQWTSSSFRARRLAAAAVSLLTGSQLLLGYPQYVMFSVIAESCYVVILSCSHRQWKPMIWWVTAKSLGLAIGAAQWLPTLQALRLSPRMDYDRDFRGTGSLPPQMLWQLLAPTVFNEFMQVSELTVYAGSMATLGLIWWLTRGQLCGTNVLDRWVFWMIVISIPLALGTNTPLYSVYRKLPIVGLFRFPCRFLVLFHLAMVIVVARFVERLNTCSSQPLKPRTLACMFVICGSAFFFSWNAINRAEYFRSDLWKYIVENNFAYVGAIVLFSAAILTIFASVGYKTALALLLGLGFADLGYYGIRTLDLPPLQRLGLPPTNTYQFVDFQKYQSKETKPHEIPAGRIDVPDHHGDALMMFGYELTRGYVGLSPPKVLDYSQPAAQRLAGTQWQFDGTNWTPINGLPLARLVSEVKVSSQPQLDIAETDIERTALVDLPLDLDNGPPGTATIANQRPGRVELITNTSGRQFLILGQSYHSNWQATIDDSEARIICTFGDFQGIVVPDGEHRIAFTYLSRSHRLGRWISISGLGVVFFGLISLLIVDKKPR